VNQGVQPHPCCEPAGMAALASPTKLPSEAGAAEGGSQETEAPIGSPEGSPRAASLANEVNAAKGILDNAASPKEAMLDALSSLQAMGTIPTKILSQTMIGKTVNSLAKIASVEGVREAAQKLVNSWKDTHRKRKASMSLDRTQSLSVMERAMSMDSMAASPPARASLSTDSLDAPCAPAPEEDKNKMTPKREKIRDKIAEAFGESGTLESKEGSANDGVDLKDASVLAAEIEAALHAHFQGTLSETSSNDKKVEAEKNYISQARAVLFNLKDKKNSVFKFKLQVGAILPEHTPKLGAADMASDEKNAERRKQKEDAMAAIDQDWAMKNGQIRISGLFTCGKCKGTQTTYFQMQTRSSDEPMTTFASCLQCGNRWKFC